MERRPALAAALLSGCLQAPAVGPRLPDGGPPSSFSAIAAELLVPRCASTACHGGSPAAYSPSLEPDRAWVEMVGVPAAQLPSMRLVAPGDPAGSYLVAKLRDGGASAGGYGDLMPPGGDALSEAEILAIEAWIAGGAPDD